MRGRQGVGQLFAKGDLVEGSDAALIQISAAGASQPWPAITGQVGPKPRAVVSSWLFFRTSSILA